MKSLEIGNFSMIILILKLGQDLHFCAKYLIAACTTFPSKRHKKILLLLTLHNRIEWHPSTIQWQTHNMHGISFDSLTHLTLKFKKEIPNDVGLFCVFSNKILIFYSQPTMSNSSDWLSGCFIVLLLPFSSKIE